jgi:hypothetical protein
VSWRIWKWGNPAIESFRERLGARGLIFSPIHVELDR